MEKNILRVAFIGLGGRGSCLLNMALSIMPYMTVTAVCDVYEDRIENAKHTVIRLRGTEPFGTTDYRKVLDKSVCDCVVVSAAWITHIPVCIDAMEAGIPVASEVGGAYSVMQCWDLVRTYEKTRTPVMLLENCCYGHEEMTVLNMVRQGVFGEIIHAEGGYQHDLRDEVSLGHENRHYRLDEYLNRNGEIYPTHELGPIAKTLNINRGNRMLALSSMASKSKGANAWIYKNRGPEFENANSDFTEGDVVTTMIKCAHGETVVLTHDTTLPRPYSRGNRIQGTKAIWSEDKHGVYIDGVTKSTSWTHDWEDISGYFEKYQGKLWEDYISNGVVGGHDGIDYLSLSAYFYAVMNKTPMPIDVYDMAAWMVITPLSEESIAMGSMPVPVPDFTNGKWMHRKYEDIGPYSL